MEISMDLWCLNKIKVILTLSKLNYVGCIPFFLYWFFQDCSQLSQIIKKSYSQIFEKRDQASINLTNVIDIIG